MSDSRYTLEGLPKPTCGTLEAIRSEDERTLPVGVNRLPEALDTDGQEDLMDYLMQQSSSSPLLIEIKRQLEENPESLGLGGQMDPIRVALGMAYQIGASHVYKSLRRQAQTNKSDTK